MKSNLINNKNLKIDKKAKCISFFVRDLPFSINKKIIKEMMVLSKKNNESNVRICLHKNKKAIQHDMIILERNKNVYPPHRHRNKGECFHVIVGKLKVIIFDKFGKIKNKIILKTGDVARIKKNSFHAVISLSDPVVYHESSPGPFLGKKDSIFPSWLPKEKNALQDYYSKLLSI